MCVSTCCDACGSLLHQGIQQSHTEAIPLFDSGCNHHRTLLHGYTRVPVPLQESYRSVHSARDPDTVVQPDVCSLCWDSHWVHHYFSLCDDKMQPLPECESIPAQESLLGDPVSDGGCPVASSDLVDAIHGGKVWLGSSLVLDSLC